MLKIESILNHIKNGISTGSDRYDVIDDQHVLDLKTGVKLHLYDDWFKISRNDEIIATIQDFDPSVEHQIIWEIKELITPVGVAEKKKATHMDSVKKRREVLSGLFEVPEQLLSTSIPMEVGATEYIG